MSTDSPDQYPVKLGDADLLIAFTAFFIAYTAAYHQRQVILRNSPSPENSITQLLRLLWTSRASKHQTPKVPTAIAAVIGVVFLVSFTAAGGFSSRISSSVGDEVLVSSSRCGRLYSNFKSSDQGSLQYFTESLSNAANYVQQCYTGAKGTVGCGRFAKPRLPTTLNTSAACPFPEEMCRSPSRNIRLDTGFLDSHKDFGLNSPPDQRVLWRKVLQCAPLVTKGFSKQETLASYKVTSYYYGARFPYDYLYRSESVQLQYARVLSQELELTPVYDIGGVIGEIRNGKIDTNNSDFVPIDLLHRNDADVSIVFLSGNGVVYSSPTSDEWYQVSSGPTNSTVLTLGEAYNTPVYLPMEPASPLGCTEQHQFCSTEFPGTSGCGPLGSMRDALAGVTPFFNTTYTDFAAGVASGDADAPGLARLVYFATHFFWEFSFSVSATNLLGSASLLSNRNSGVQGSLPSNQWQLDVNHLWDISLAKWQAMFVDTAHSITYHRRLQIWQNFSSPSLEKLCNSQKIRSTAYGSFSVFSLAFTFGVGILIILTSYLLEPILRFVYKKGYSQYPYLEWVTNGTLQLQRLAHEEMKLGTWSNCSVDMPLAAEDELLGCLDITDLKHPILSAPSIPLGQSASSRGSLIPEPSSNTATAVGADNSIPVVSSKNNELA
ncbi:hypothetical protein F4778DRAFT_794546 [Xylariomycetidae sp. FL2044]|nr:hypothetical protein F4778DRAFT_794546 [Xylariomycetidae sp. FL2044]